MQEKWRTSITAAYKRRCVLRAAFIGGIGVAALVAGGSFMPVDELSIFGFPLLLVAGGLMTWSMLPYRKMTRLEDKPDELWISPKGAIVYAKGGNPTLTIPEIAISKIFYIDKPDIYGICISIKPQPLEKVRIHDGSLDYAHFQYSNIRTYGCDIFLPFFSARTCEAIKEYIFGESEEP